METVAVVWHTHIVLFNGGLGTLEDDRTVLYKTKSLDGNKPNTNPNPKTKPNPSRNQLNSIQQDITDVDADTSYVRIYV